MIANVIEILLLQSKELNFVPGKRREKLFREKNIVNMESENKTEETKAGGEAEASATTTADKTSENDKKEVAASGKEIEETAPAAEKENSAGAGDEANDKNADKAPTAAENDDKKPKSESDAETYLTCYLQL
ncbi:PREDICTED: uncharacterized protein LOC108358276 [Rhagoletis zephyria]|uniref:uncharacterized protein LOC108358276 n=1 Tax=Rhagoletis zephyria TaxID=28612 RepID=UPI0008117284|nr:PREDICTED: uncharacterized protein LOC108358276 [Rhagoletis zephyria]